MKSENYNSITIPANTRIETKHNKITEVLVEKIESGKLTGKLPGVSKLAKEFSVNPLTICKALDSLDKLGMIERIPRIGTFVKHKKRIGLLNLTTNQKYLESPSTGKDHTFTCSSIYTIASEGIQKVINQYHFSMLSHSVSPNEKDFINFLKKEVDGFIVLCGSETKKEKYFELFNDIPNVRIMGKADLTMKASHVTYDNSVIGKLAAGYLMSQNCERYYYFGGNSNPLFSERLEVFQRELAAHGFQGEFIDLDIAQIELKELIKRGKDVFAEIFSGNFPKTGLFLSADVYCVPVYQMLYGMGLTPCQDLPIISCNNNYHYLRGLYPQPAEIDIKMREIGEKSAITLTEMLVNKDFSTTCEKIILTPEIIFPEQ
jgi:DNA-binding LacI/PurR family transcriptional regulator